MPGAPAQNRRGPLLDSVRAVLDGEPQVFVGGGSIEDEEDGGDGNDTCFDAGRR